MRWPAAVFVLLTGLLLIGQVFAQQTASTLFGELRPTVYQVRIIDAASGDKAGLGSGFLISADGHVATNYHVIQSLVDEPEKHRLELVNDTDTALEATLIGIDVINDLAIVRLAIGSARHFKLRTQPINNGERIYSMGNPHDLGMTIIEGNYNGRVKSSRFERFLFSGSLNSGMSGGPAFDEHGHLVGVNVAKGGEQLSFLVPAKYLTELFKRVQGQTEAPDFKAQITANLLAEQDTFYDKRISEQWNAQSFGDLELPKDLNPTMKCWGHNIDNSDNKRAYEAFHQHCTSEEFLYLTDDFYTGNFAYDFEWMTTKNLNPLQFYTAVQSRFTHNTPDNTYSDTHVSPYACKTDFIELDERRWKGSVCLRSYLNHAGMYDAMLVLGSAHLPDRAAVIRMTATGVSRPKALALFSKLMRAIKWAR
ncbi:MAG: trypsin-like peptidase domain-containing protein [Chromatiales bacterium]|nr:trypsin-like peptidase domain-containing protein [Chromatiales bacterium]